jgi:hypothetical protein
VFYLCGTGARDGEAGLPNESGEVVTADRGDPTLYSIIMGGGKINDWTNWMETMWNGREENLHWTERCICWYTSSPTVSRDPYEVDRTSNSYRFHSIAQLQVHSCLRLSTVSYSIHICKTIRLPFFKWRRAVWLKRFGRTCCSHLQDSKKTAILIFTAVRTWNLKKL